MINGDATLLKGSVTKSAMYDDVQRADQLNGVFNSIAQNLAGAHGCRDANEMVANSFTVLSVY